MKINEKMHQPCDLPKIIDVGHDEKMAKRFGSGKMLIAPPIEFDQIMKEVPKGKLLTVPEIRNNLARKHGADFTCQLTAGIFVNMVANAAHERVVNELGDDTPFWRTLKKDGELNIKYPGGIEEQKMKLEDEGHEVIQKGQRYFVKNFEDKLWRPQE